jgi:hypothetical protein
MLSGSWSQGQSRDMAAFVNVVVASLFPNRLRTYLHFQGGVLEYHLPSDRSL